MSYESCPNGSDCRDDSIWKHHGRQLQMVAAAGAAYATRFAATSATTTGSGGSGKVDCVHIDYP